MITYDLDQLEQEIIQAGRLERRHVETLSLAARAVAMLENAQHSGEDAIEELQKLEYCDMMQAAADMNQARRLTIKAAQFVRAALEATAEAYYGSPEALEFMGGATRFVTELVEAARPQDMSGADLLYTAQERAAAKQYAADMQTRADQAAQKLEEAREALARAEMRAEETAYDARKAAERAQQLEQA